jgi:hypothetical protein
MNLDIGRLYHPLPYQRFVVGDTGGPVQLRAIGMRLEAASAAAFNISGGMTWAEVSNA